MIARNRATVHNHPDSAQHSWGLGWAPSGPVPETEPRTAKQVLGAGTREGLADSPSDYDVVCFGRVRPGRLPLCFLALFEPGPL